MKAQNAKEFLPLVQALADGLTIEFNDGGDWVNVVNLNTDSYDPDEYRIKPEPRRWTMVRCLNNGFIYEDTGTDRFDSDVWERITVVEVLE